MIKEIERERREKKEKRERKHMSLSELGVAAYNESKPNERTYVLSEMKKVSPISCSDARLRVSAWLFLKMSRK